MTVQDIILHGVVGSHAYGLNHANSDEDTAGIFRAPMKLVLGLSGYSETITRTDKEDKDADPDYTFHEVKKFMQLAAKANPTAMEYLWLNEYLTLTPNGELLIAHRREFLTQNVRNSYGGYARQQLVRFKSTGNFGADLKKRSAKNARHLTRLVIQGKEILETGNLTIKLSELHVNLCNYMSDLCIEDPEHFIECAELMLEDLDNCKSELPHEVNMELLNELLYQIRLSK